MRWSIAAAALATLAACAKPPALAPDPSAVAPPIPADVAVTITQAQDGKTVRAPAGARIAVALRGIPTAGYVWAAPAPPAFLALEEQRSGPTTSAQLQPGFAGGSHWEVLVFRVLGPGSGALRLEQNRPWDPEGDPNAVFAVTLEAR